MSTNLIEQQLVIDHRKRLDGIARQRYEQNEQLLGHEEAMESHAGVVVRSRVERFKAALRHMKTVKARPAT